MTRKRPTKKPTLTIPQTQSRQDVTHDGDIVCTELVWVAGTIKGHKIVSLSIDAGSVYARSIYAENVDAWSIYATRITIAPGCRLRARYVVAKQQTWTPGPRGADGRCEWTLMEAKK